MGNEHFPLGDPALSTKDPVGILSDGFLAKTILERVLYAVVASAGVQCKYFMAWKLGEAAAVGFGYGYHGGAWDGCQNLDLSNWLMAENMSTASKSWNQKTQVWLQTYTYFRVSGSRLTKVMSTYAVSAYWHGFYPGYYLTFFTLGYLSTIQDKIVVHLRPWFLVSDGSATGGLKKFYDACCI